MKKTKISKKINEIRKSTDYDLTKIVNEMKSYYNESKFENKVLLKRLNKLRVEKFYFDTLQGSIIGLFVSMILADIGILEGLSGILDAGIQGGNLAKILAMFFVLVIVIGIVVVMLLAINIVKFLQYKVMKTDALNNYLDEIEEKIIKDILQNRIEDIQE